MNSGSFLPLMQCRLHHLIYHTSRQTKVNLLLNPTFTLLVPEGAVYYVDDGSTECKCPDGGGSINCRFMPCPELPTNCIEQRQPPDGCPECVRTGCLDHHGQKYDSGFTFRMPDCQVCHCPVNGLQLLCYPMPGCDPSTNYETFESQEASYGPRGDTSDSSEAYSYYEDVSESEHTPSSERMHPAGWDSETEQSPVQGDEISYLQSPQTQPSPVIAHERATSPPRRQSQHIANYVTSSSEDRVEQDDSALETRSDGSVNAYAQNELETSNWNQKPQVDSWTNIDDEQPIFHAEIPSEVPTMPDGHIPPEDYTVSQDYMTSHTEGQVPGIIPSEQYRAHADHTPSDHHFTLEDNVSYGHFDSQSEFNPEAPDTLNYQAQPDDDIRFHERVSSDYYVFSDNRITSDGQAEALSQTTPGSYITSHGGPSDYDSESDVQHASEHQLESEDDTREDYMTPHDHYDSTHLEQASDASAITEDPRTSSYLPVPDKQSVSDPITTTNEEQSYAQQVELSTSDEYAKPHYQTTPEEPGTYDSPTTIDHHPSGEFDNPSEEQAPAYHPTGSEDYMALGDETKGTSAMAHRDMAEWMESDQHVVPYREVTIDEQVETDGYAIPRIDSRVEQDHNAEEHYAVAEPVESEYGVNAGLQIAADKDMRTDYDTATVDHVASPTEVDSDQYAQEWVESNMTPSTFPDRPSYDAPPLAEAESEHDIFSDHTTTDDLVQEDVAMTTDKHFTSDAKIPKDVPESEYTLDSDYLEPDYQTEIDYLAAPTEDTMDTDHILQEDVAMTTDKHFTSDAKIPKGVPDSEYTLDSDYFEPDYQTEIDSLAAPTEDTMVTDHILQEDALSDEKGHLSTETESNHGITTDQTAPTRASEVLHEIASHKDTTTDYYVTADDYTSSHKDATHNKMEPGYETKAGIKMQDHQVTSPNDHTTTTHTWSHDELFHGDISPDDRPFAHEDEGAFADEIVSDEQVLADHELSQGVVKGVEDETPDITDLGDQNVSDGSIISQEEIPLDYSATPDKDYILQEDHMTTDDKGKNTGGIAPVYGPTLEPRTDAYEESHEETKVGNHRESDFGIPSDRTQNDYHVTVEHHLEHENAASPEQPQRGDHIEPYYHVSPEHDMTPEGHLEYAEKHHGGEDHHAESTKSEEEKTGRIMDGTSYGVTDHWEGVVPNRPPGNEFEESVHDSRKELEGTHILEEGRDAEHVQQGAVAEEQDVDHLSRTSKHEKYLGGPTISTGFTTKASAEDTVERCCEAGLTWASETGRCSDLPLLEGAEEDQGCRVSQEQCCQASLQEANCQSGLSAAQNGGTCTAMNLDTCGQDHFKRCCDCCTLGIDAQKRGHSCTTIPALGYPCSHVFHACCQSGGLPGDVTRVKADLHHQKTHRDVYKEPEAPGLYTTEQPPQWEQTKWPSVVQQSYVTPVSAEEDELTEDTENSISEESAEDHNPPEPRGPREHYEMSQDVSEIQEDPSSTTEIPISQETQASEESHDVYDRQEPPDVSDSQEYPTYDHHQPEEADRNLRRQNVPHSYTSQTSEDPSANEEHESDDQILQEQFQDEDHRSGISTDHHTTIEHHLGSRWSQERNHHSFTGTDSRYEAQVSQWPEEVETQTITQGEESEEEEESLRSSAQGHQGEGEECVEMCDNEEDDGHCTCDPGYELLEEQDTCGDIDECLTGSHNCREEQRCVNTEGSFHCLSQDRECLPGFIRNIHGDCQDVNECFAETHNCAMGERCVNTNGSFQCVRNDACEVGYRLGRDNQCQDIDECRDGTNHCPTGTQCHNTPGAFNCRARSHCAEGFDQYPNGGCVDVNECAAQSSPCQPSFNCINTIGSYTCQRNLIQCGRGFHANSEGDRCVDVDECETGLHRCQEDQHCRNTPGAHRCDCKIGYEYNQRTRLCMDVNECWRFPGRLCAHECRNTPGSYLCSCSAGFKLAVDSRSCEDVDECTDSPCGQECANTYGSYRCYCQPGYVLNEFDGTSCEDVDECTQPGSQGLCAFECHNTLGSYECTCPDSGYMISPNGRSCRDIDECALGSNNCSSTESCFNIQGSFRCLTYDCPPHYKRASLMRCERTACHDYMACQDIPVRITYYQISFPMRLRVPATIFRIGPSPPYPGDNILLSITSGDPEHYFAARKLNGHTGVLVLRRAPSEPRDFLVKLQMKLFRHGSITTFAAHLHVIVTASPFGSTAYFVD
uniref:uncharacterized protein n=1 Tax=Myxine glutinosa TaxID=7769 RepID=UPI00358F4E7C